MSWTNVTVGDAFDFVRNGKNVKQSKEVDGLPITRIETIADRTIDPARVGYAGLSEAGNEQWLLRKGDILFSHINSVDHIGKCAIYEGAPEKLIHGMNLLALRPGKLLHPKFAYYALSDDIFRARLLPFVNKAVNQASVSTTNLKALEIPLPPLEEQKRIAEILDKADQLRQKRRQAIALLDSLTQSIFLEMFGDPVSNPKGLQKAPLGNLIKVSSGNGLTSAQMDTAGIYSVYGGNGINGSHSAYMFEDPQIAIGRVGVYCGAVHVTKSKSWITDNALYISKNLSGLRLRYLAEALRMANLNQYAGRAAQPLISGSRIYPVEILVPSEEMQFTFEKLLLAADANHRQIYKSQEQIDAAFSSLQHRAFSGQL